MVARTKRRLIRGWWCMLAGCCVIGCAGSQSPAVELLAEVVPCTAEAPDGFLLHTNQALLARWLQARSAALTTAVDFDQHIALIADFGVQPNPAWSIELRAPGAQIKDGVAQVEMGLAAPPAGRRVIQKLNHPCAIFRIERGKFQWLEVIDGKRQLARFAVD